MIRLDKSRIPPELVDDPRLQRLEEQILELMQDPTYRSSVCLHEAAHATYYERAGARRVIYHGPVAFYDVASDTFDLGNAAIEPDFGEAGQSTDLLTMCRCLVAGKVATDALTAREDEDGDGRDREEFARLCAQHCPNMAPKEISEFWEYAKNEVMKDLRSPAFRRGLWERAREFEEWLLGN